MMSLTASIGLWPGLPSPPPQQKGDEDWVGRSSAPSRPLGGSWATSVQGWRAREPAGLRTGPDGMSYDVDDDAGNAEVRHPGDRVLGERKRVHICSLHLQGQGWKGAVGAGWGWHGEAGTGEAPPHLQGQCDCDHAAGSEADGEAEEEEQSSPQQLHDKHLPRVGVGAAQGSPWEDRPGRTCCMPKDVGGGEGKAGYSTGLQVPTVRDSPSLGPNQDAGGRVLLLQGQTQLRSGWASLGVHPALDASYLPISGLGGQRELGALSLAASEASRGAEPPSWGHSRYRWSSVRLQPRCRPSRTGRHCSSRRHSGRSGLRSSKSGRG